MVVVSEIMIYFKVAQDLKCEEICVSIKKELDKIKNEGELGIMDYVMTINFKPVIDSNMKEKENASTKENS